MFDISEICHAPETQQLCCRFGDRFSKSYSSKRKQEVIELYGESYFYRNVAKEFGIEDHEDIRILSAQGRVLWVS